MKDPSHAASSSRGHQNALRVLLENADHGVGGRVASAVTDARKLGPVAVRIVSSQRLLVGVPGLPLPPVLRHTIGSWLSMRGVPMRHIQAILGHSDWNVTEKYSHLAPETLDRAMEETFGRDDGGG